MTSTTTLPANALRHPAASLHLPELDGVRGIAILSVLLSHAVWFLGVVPVHVPGVHWGDAVAAVLSPGWGGVDLFFTLSGFLITGILLRARKSSTYFSSFYMRRVLRIFPIYYFALISTSLVVLVHPQLAKYFPIGLRARIPYFVFLQNWPVFWKDWTGMATYWGLYWSLAVEEQFYMIWPAFLRIVRLRVMFLFCLAGFCLGLPIRAYLVHRIGLQFGIMQLPFSRLDGLFLGAAIAIYRQIHARPVSLRWGLLGFSAGAGLYGWIAFFHIPELTSGNGAHIWTLGVSAFAFMSGGLVVATQHRVAVIHRILTVQPLLTAGRLSYGMYIYHLFLYLPLYHVFAHRRLAFIPNPLFASDGAKANPLIVSLDIFLAIVVVMVVAELSYRFVETPFLRLKRFFPSPVAPAGQTI